MAIASVLPTDVHTRGGTSPIRLIDVRSPAEFAAVHAAGATSLPLDRLDAAAITLLSAQGQPPLYFICETSNRSSIAAERLLAAGVQGTAIVAGGTKAWVAAGLPVIRGRAVISLERQVRIVAGSLVALGTVLGWVVHPYFLAVPAFVGAGLTVAGITDTCGMGLVLARMPWNQRPTVAAPAPAPSPSP